MDNYRKRSNIAHHADCSGCSLCLLVCPLWRRRRDLLHSPHGWAKALQHRVDPAELAGAVQECTLCRACDPVCPEQIDVSGMILKLRGQIRHPQTAMLQERIAAQTRRPAQDIQERTALLAGDALRSQPALLNRIVALLRKAVVAHDDGTDISLAMEAGVAVPPERLAAMIKPLRRAHRVIAADGLLLPYLAQWLPAARILSLGETLSSLEVVRKNLRATDLYVIEPRAYHADHVRLVRHYDRLRKECGCEFNLDLQRIAIPATAHNNLAGSMQDDEQARWVLHGRSFDRIVVESIEDRAVFQRVSDVPVVHLAELAER